MEASIGSKGAGGIGRALGKTEFVGSEGTGSLYYLPSHELYLGHKHTGNCSYLHSQTFASIGQTGTLSLPAGTVILAVYLQLKKFQVQITVQY